MKKYGDLIYGEDIDISLETLVKQIVEKNSSFNNIWDALCSNIDTDLKIDRDFNRKYINYVLDKDSPNPDLIYIQNLLREDKDIFRKIFTPYVELTWFQWDLRTCLKYNFDCDKRKKTLKEPNRFNDIDDYICEKGSLPYSVPFDYKSNAFTDFCAYTWESLYKSKSSMESFRIKRNRDYINPYIFSKIIEDLSCPCKKTVISNNDRWLIEKIFGLNTIIELMPVVNEYYSKENFEKVIIPLLNTLLKCKPVFMRISLANIVGTILYEIPKSSKNSPYNDSKVNRIYDKNTIKNLLDNLMEVIKVINCKYTTLLKRLYEAKIILDKPPVEIILAENDKCKMYNGLDISQIPRRIKETPIDIAYDILLNKTENGKVIEKLLSSAKKRNYNSNDLAWRYGTMQLQAITFISNLLI